MSAPTVLSGGADDRYPGRTVGVHEVSTRNMTKTERLNRVSRLLKQTPRQLAKRYGKNGRMTDDGLERAERQAGVEHRVDAVDYDAHFGGTGVSLQHFGEKDIPLDSDSLLYAMKAFKRKLKQGIDAKKRQSNADLTGEYEESDRAPQLVHSCDTAGPGLTYCDPMVEGQCPDPKDLVGTPYENIWSTVGVPPNNKVVQCVPKDLVPLTTDSEKKEENMERKMHKIMMAISANAKGIQDLSKWRDVAPCEAIPAMAFGENNNMCGSLYNKDDRMVRRCMDAKVAAKLLDGDAKTRAEAAANEESQRTCYNNPKEQIRTITSLVNRVQLWRQKLRHAVENAMRVPDFVALFNRMAQQSKSKYYPTQGQSFNWYMVNDYMMHDDIGSVKDVKDKTETCQDAEREMRKIEQLLSGGGDTCEEDHGCESRLLRVLKIMHRMTEEEKKLRQEFATWMETNATRLHAIQKDEECKAHTEDPNFCSTVNELCPNMTLETSGEEDLQQNCIATPGGGSVHSDNQDVTWTMEGFSDEGHMKGFRYIEDPDVMGLFSKYQKQAWQQCASTRNAMSMKTKDLREAHQKKVAEIGNILRQHYGKAYGQVYQQQYKEAEARTADAQIVRQTQEEALQRAVEAAVRRAMGKEEAPGASAMVASRGSVASAPSTPSRDNVLSPDIIAAAEEDPQVYIQLYPKTVAAELMQPQARVYKAFESANNMDTKKQLFAEMQEVFGEVDEE